MDHDLRQPVDAALRGARSALSAFLAEEKNTVVVADMAALLARCLQDGGKVLACGNGGSLCDAVHFAEEFTGRYRKNRRPLPVLALSDPAHLTCVGNDFGFEEVFSRGVEAFGAAGDVLVALSTSGNSVNILKAVEAARVRGLKILLFLGKDGGQLSGRGTAEIVVREKTSDRVQEIHMMCLHIIIEAVERELFPENYRD